MGTKVNPDSAAFLIVRPDSEGDTVGKFYHDSDAPIEVGDKDDEVGRDIVVVELNGFDKLANHPLDRIEDWFY